MYKKFAVVLETFGALLVVGTIGNADAPAVAGAMSEAAMNLRLLAGAGVTILGYAWSRFLNVPEQKRQDSYIRDETYIREIKKSAQVGRPLSTHQNNQD